MFLCSTSKIKINKQSVNYNNYNAAHYVSNITLYARYARIRNCSVYRLNLHYSNILKKV